MKNPFIIIIVLALVGIVGYLAIGNTPKEPTTHVMEDGSVMSNEDTSMSETTTVTPTEETTAPVPSDAGMEFPTADADAALSVDSSVKAFTVAGVNHLFDVEEIRVKEGDMVTINFVSDDGFHDWVVDEFDAATDQVRPGVKTSVTFVADKKGTFEYYCSVGDHRARGMVGKLIVE